MKIKRCNCPDIPENTIHKLATVIIQNGKTLVVKKKGLDEHLSLGGKHESGESFEECLKREALEELNIKIFNLKFLGRYSDVTTDIGAPIILDAFWAETNDTPKPQEEIEDFIWVDKDFKDVSLASIIRLGIIPDLVKKGLI